MIIIKEIQRMSQKWLWLLLISINIFFLYNLISSSNFEIINLFSVLVLLSVTYFFYRIKLIYSITEKSIIINFAPFLKKTIQINDIVGISIIKYRPLKDYGGWGIRIKNNITAYTIGGNTGILISLKNKEQILIGSKFKIDFLYFKLEELLKLCPNIILKKDV